MARRWWAVALLALLLVPGCGDDCDVVPVAPVVEHEDDDEEEDCDRGRGGGRDSLGSWYTKQKGGK